MTGMTQDGTPTPVGETVLDSMDRLRQSLSPGDLDGRPEYDGMSFGVISLLSTQQSGTDEHFRKMVESFSFL